MPHRFTTSSCSRSTDILPVLFGRIVIPRAVAEELQHRQTPTVMRVWMATPPAWLSIQDVSTASEGNLAHLDPGEQGDQVNPRHFMPI